MRQIHIKIINEFSFFCCWCWLLGGQGICQKGKSWKINEKPNRKPNFRPPLEAGGYTFFVGVPFFLCHKHTHLFAHYHTHTHTHARSLARQDTREIGLHKICKKRRFTFCRCCHTVLPKTNFSGALFFQNFHKFL